MKIAVFANSRTALQARHSMAAAFDLALGAGSVMGFALVSLVRRQRPHRLARVLTLRSCAQGVLMMLITVSLFRNLYPAAFSNGRATEQLFEAVAGFGLGGSCVAMFGRVGGGICELR